MLDDYFKNEKVVCNFEKACKNKSKVFCRECSRNFHVITRDWFNPTEEYKNLLKMIKRV
jgi:hypothetical protein